MYAIVDIETTGGSPSLEKITEIAVFIYDGNKIINEFSSLINPEKSIPYYILKTMSQAFMKIQDWPNYDLFTYKQMNFVKPRTIAYIN